jgi:kinesin family protein 2/24
MPPQVKIMTRIKPILSGSNNSCARVNNDEIIVCKKQKRFQDESEVNHKYLFDSVFDDQSSNSEIYDKISIEMLKTVIRDKLNVTFYVYGQTGSGKTHTVIGSDSEYGMLDMMLLDILEICKTTKVSLVEIYNNKCYDILNSNKLVHQREDYNNAFVMNNLLLKNVNSKVDIKEIKNIVCEKRRVGLSGENDRSSRSHLQITIKVDNCFIKMLDLAGCEKASTSVCNERKEFRENGEINQSLFALKECIRSQLQNKSHIPFRRCELTKMLRSSFEANTKTFVLSTISQETKHASVSVDVLNYVFDMKNIKRKVEKKFLPDIKKGPIVSYPFNELGSPRYKLVYHNKSILEKLNIKEKELL